MCIWWTYVNIRRGSTGGRVADVGDAHEAGERRGRHASALVEDLAGHAQALALGDTAALAHGDTSSILSTLLRRSVL